MERVILMGTWGFPMSRQDLSHIIKGYLDRLGRTNRFINNLPGPDFMIGFMNRHPELSVRTANLIKRGRAALSHQEVNEFFDRVEKELEGVPPENIWNYDETNLTDDPGAKKAIFKRGVKYAEQIRNHSKSTISTMFCGNAAGDMVPPYIVFKAENLWKGWCLNGPKGSRYNTSPSGWFNGFIYSDWFLRRGGMVATARAWRGDGGIRAVARAVVGGEKRYRTHCINAPNVRKRTIRTEEKNIYFRTKTLLPWIGR